MIGGLKGPEIGKMMGVIIVHLVREGRYLVP